MKALQDPNHVWAAHSTSGHCVQKPDASGVRKQVKKCMAEKCYAKLTTLNSVTCQQCLKEVCLKHRFEDDHQCTHVIKN